VGAPSIFPPKIIQSTPPSPTMLPPFGLFFIDVTSFLVKTDNPTAPDGQSKPHRYLISPNLPHRFGAVTFSPARRALSPSCWTGYQFSLPVFLGPSKVPSPSHQSPFLLYKTFFPFLSREPRRPGFVFGPAFSPFSPLTTPPPSLRFSSFLNAFRNPLETLFPQVFPPIDMTAFSPSHPPWDTFTPS